MQKIKCLFKISFSYSPGYTHGGMNTHGIVNLVSSEFWAEILYVTRPWLPHKTDVHVCMCVWVHMYGLGWSIWM